MSYHLDAVTLRMDNSPSSQQSLQDVWADITSGKLPLLFNNDGTFQAGLSPVSCYSGYASDETGPFDCTIRAVSSNFFTDLEKQTAQGHFRKYTAKADDLAACAQDAWQQVWKDTQSGVLKRRYAEDFESTVPGAYTKDGKCWCYLYISVET